MEQLETPVTSEQLLAENAALQARLEEAEETMRAIRTGAVDALVVESPEGQKVFTLKGAEHTYRMLVETMSEGALTMALDGIILYSNVSFAQLLNRPLEKVIGTRLQEYIESSQLPAFQELLLRPNRPRRREFNLVSGEGSTVPAYIALSPLAVDEASEAIAAVVTDLTEQKHAEELARDKGELEKLVALRTSSLQATTDQLNAFCYSIAHDLRAPLRQQTAYGRALLEDCAEGLNDTGRNYATRIVAAAERLQQLVDDLLTYATFCRQDLTKKSVSLSQVLKQVHADLAESIAQKDAQIAIALPVKDVIGHEATLNQVVANLLSNALKYMAPGVKPRIRIWSEDRGDRIRLWVEDNGIGIKRDYHDRIFGVFERLHRKEEFPGTGMGLAIVQKGIQSMGGRVGLESSPGNGSRFWIELAKA
jgi:PAS domain S-box-containing protein